MDCTCEWEYANNNELDGSPDNGAWTSLDTNNANPNDDVIVEAEQEESVETSVASSEDSTNDKDIPVEKCTKCHFSKTKGDTVCFNGSSWIKESACNK